MITFSQTLSCRSICLSLFCTTYGWLVSKVTWLASGLWTLLLSHSWAPWGYLHTETSPAMKKCHTSRCIPTCTLKTQHICFHPLQDNVLSVFSEQDKSNSIYNMYSTTCQTLQMLSRFSKLFYASVPSVYNRAGWCIFFPASHAVIPLALTILFQLLAFVLMLTRACTWNSHLCKC